MRAFLGLLLCLPLLATMACAADAVAGPEPASGPDPTALRGVEQEVVQAAPRSLPRIVIRRLKVSPPPAEPLYVIDGAPAPSDDALARMEAGDIDSIQVIKGEALSALYGNRLLTGVVIITTRHAAASRRR
jgi:hypothetical protein